MPGKRGVPLSDDQKALIRAYIDSQKLHSTPREKLAALILQDLGIEISGVSAAKIRREAFDDIDTANSRKEACIREKVLEHVEVEAPKVLGYIQDEIQALRLIAYGDKEQHIEPKKMGIRDRTTLSNAILACCKTLIDIVGTPKPDRHIQTTIQVVPTCDVSEYMTHGDKYGSGDEDRTGFFPASDQ